MKLITPVKLGAPVHVRALLCVLVLSVRVYYLPDPQQLSAQQNNILSILLLYSTASPLPSLPLLPLLLPLLLLPLLTLVQSPRCRLHAIPCHVLGCHLDSHDSLWRSVASMYHTI